MAEGTYEVEMLMFQSEKFESIMSIIMKSFVEYRKQEIYF